MRAHRLRVTKVIEETNDAKSLVFEQPAEFHYRPGQFLTLRVGEAARCYSLSSSPHTDDSPTVTVKRTPEGYASNWIHDNVVAGMEIDMLPPGGVFTPTTLDDDLLCCAAGSGMTPIMSIVKSVLAAGSGTITLIYANRDERSVIFRAALADLATVHPTRLTVIHWLESVQGLPNTPALRALLEPFAAREAFVCGPTPFMDAAATALESLGAPRIRIERFVSLVKNPWNRRVA
ncbi:MAG TPA: FAD-binding oxidoreductase [Pseudonocardiaceae bacterium]|jgi:3-ketosteroid 9alpha-monooxygenase subunit B|nr:FAD-binding oxidoreductase [Pseudonocardiaceae bacterium]